MTTHRDEIAAVVLGILAPRRTVGTRTDRYPIFEWTKETTPTPTEMEDLSMDIADAVAALNDQWSGMVPVDCDKHAVAIDDGEGGSYACPICERDVARRDALAPVLAECDLAENSLPRGYGLVSIARIRRAAVESPRGTG